MGREKEYLNFGEYYLLWKEEHYLSLKKKNLSPKQKSRDIKHFVIVLNIRIKIVSI